MIFKLDWWLFGNGHGLGSPYFNDTFYWLNGRFYTWIGGFGAQLQSIEWFAPRIGDSRRINGIKFVPFNCTRKGPRVRISWAVDRKLDDYAAIEKLLKDVTAIC